MKRDPVELAEALEFKAMVAADSNKQQGRTGKEYALENEIEWQAAQALRDMAGALEKIAAEDDTGPLVFEQDERGRMRASHNAKGRFAEIARAALSPKGGEHE